MPIALHLALLLACSGSEAPATPATPAPTAATAADPTAPDATIPTPSPPPESDAHMLPTPFTLAQMKAGWVPGVKVRFRMEVAGEGTTLHDWEVRSNPDPDHVVTAITIREEAGGAALGTPTARSMAYEELRQHAAFPASHATMEQARVQTPRGELPGRRYRVRKEDDPSTVVTFEFADALPGPPVLMETRVLGDVVQTMRMVERTGGPADAAP